MGVNLTVPEMVMLIRACNTAARYNWKMYWALEIDPKGRENLRDAFREEGNRYNNLVVKLQRMIREEAEDADEGNEV